MTKRADQKFIAQVNQGKLAEALKLFDVGDVDPNAVNNHKSTALHLASRTPAPGRRAFLQAMLDRGADPVRFNDQGFLPSHVALREKDWGAWEFWLAHNPSLMNRPTEQGYSPLWIAERMGDLPMGVHPITEVTFFDHAFANGLDVLHVEPNGFGLLSNACGNTARPFNAALVGTLLDRNAPVATLTVAQNVGAGERRTPLATVMMNGHVALTERFLNVGEQQALAGGDLGLNQWHQAMMQALLTTCFQEQRPDAPWAVPQGRLLDHLDRHHPNLLNRTILPREGFPEVRQPFLHALVRLQGSLHGHVGLMSLLKNHGVDLFAQDSEGRTAAQVAVRSDDREWLELHESLRDTPVAPRPRPRM